MHYFFPHLITTIFLTSLTLCSSQLNHFLKPSSPSSQQPVESIELTPPLSTTNLPNPPPECTHTILSHSFGNTFNQPPATFPYTPPHHCPPPWSAAVLHLHGSISGTQYDRIAAVWLDGAELLRTSTPEPPENPEPSENGTFWNVLKDVTRYSSVLQKSNIKVSMMLENIVNEEFTGVYHVNLTLLFYKDHRGNCGRKLALGSRDLCGDIKEPPADLIIPVIDEANEAFWFRIERETQVGSRRVKIPRNAKRIVMELYVSYHGDDEFWYSNPPNEYIEMNKLAITRGNGAFREVFVRIDGKFVGSEVPSPVIFTGGINPLSWEPVVAIGAFNLPSYDVELTPFLGSLVDGESHSFEIGVVNAIGLWLVDANLHVWVDKGFDKVDANLGVYQPPAFFEFHEYQFDQLDGSFEVEAVRSSHYSGWVASSSGNFTTSVTRKMHITNTIMFQNNGTYKIVEHKGKVKTEVSVLSDTGTLVSQKTSKRKSPLTVITSTVPGPETGTKLMITNITHGLMEKSSEGILLTSIDNIQVSGGWMLVKDHSVLSGTATTSQTLSYQSLSGCYIRSVEATDGELLRDDSTSICPSLFHKVISKMSGIRQIPKFQEQNI